MLSENSESIDGFCRYFYFDIGEAIKKKNYDQIIKTINKVDKIVQHFNSFIYDFG